LEAYKVLLEGNADDQVVQAPELRNFSRLYEYVDNEPFPIIDVGIKGPFANLGFY
jgi:hypothetical protein